MTKEEIIKKLQYEGKIKKGWIDNLGDEITINLLANGEGYRFLVFNDFTKVKQIQFKNIENAVQEYLKQKNK